MVLAPSAYERCLVLREDRELADALPPAQQEKATNDCFARAVTIPEGHWTATQPILTGASIGLLVLSGLLVRRVGIAAGFGAELLGDGDLLRPWQGKDEPPILPLTTGWTVLTGTRVAVLDEAFAGRVARYPQLIGHLVGRALQRSRNLAVNMAIVHQARVDVRLHMLLWHLAGRWGRMTSSGVSLPLRLTHRVLAELTAARRPTVTSALTELAKLGLVRPTSSGWVLTGQPPGELLEIEPALSSLQSSDPNPSP